MKNFLFSSEILPPLSEFSCVCIFAWENLSIYASQYVLHCLPQERGIPPVPTSLTPSDSFVLMNQMSPSYWFLIGNLFYDITTKRQGRRHDILKQASLLSWSHTSPLLISEQSVLLTCVWEENGPSLLHTFINFILIFDVSIQQIFTEHVRCPKHGIQHSI